MALRRNTANNFFETGRLLPPFFKPFVTRSTRARSSIIATITQRLRALEWTYVHVRDRPYAWPNLVLPKVARGREGSDIEPRHIGRTSFSSILVFFPSFSRSIHPTAVRSFNFCGTTSPLIDPGFHVRPRRSRLTSPPRPHLHILFRG